MFLSIPNEDVATLHVTFLRPIMNAAILRVPFSSPCRGVLNTPHRRFRQKTNAAILRVPFSHPIMNAATLHVPFLSPCRGVLNTPYKRFRQKTNAVYLRHPFSDVCGIRAVLHVFAPFQVVCGAYSVAPYTGTKTLRAGCRYPCPIT